MKKIILGLALLFLGACATAPQRANDRGEVSGFVNWGDNGSQVIVKASTTNTTLKNYDPGMISEFKELNPSSLEQGKKNALSRCEQWKKNQPDVEKINCYVFIAYDPKETQRKVVQVNREIEIKSKQQLMTDIRTTCKEFGYKEGTEKFADCLKDLYVKQPSPTIDSGSQAIADEMRRQRNQQTSDELLGLSRELSKGRSLGEIYGGGPPKSGGGVSCNLTNSVMSGTNRICYYKCGVSTQTSNVGAAQQCPLTM
jgi:hypothetical protein